MSWVIGAQVVAEICLERALVRPGGTHTLSSWFDARKLTNENHLVLPDVPAAG